jgi:hypothetical protein
VSTSADDAISSARGRLADERGPDGNNAISILTDGGMEVARTRIGWSVELVAQILERLVVGGLGTEAFVYGIRG